MADSVVSPDGNWLWTGNEWIPVPPETSPSIINTEVEVKNIDGKDNFDSQELGNSSNMDQDNSSNEQPLFKIIPMLGFIFLLMPFWRNILIDVNGYELLSLVINGDISIIEFDANERSSISFLSSLHYVSRSLLLLAPIAFLITSIISLLVILFSHNKNRIFFNTQYIHLTYFFTIIFFAICGSFNSDPIIEYSIFKFASFGFYLSGALPILYFIND